LAPSTTPTILGHDAAGIVEAVGPEVTTLSVGDEVWYADREGRRQPRLIDDNLTAAPSGGR
jgi:NADPH:quinone reductase-like Zn-dependent oxidoreductase